MGIKYLFFASFFLSCSFFSQKESKVPRKTATPSYKKAYELIEKGGRFSVFREVGKSKKEKDYVVKKRIYSPNEKKVVEQSIAIATPGRLKNINIVRPRIAQYTAWFDKKRYFSELRLDAKNKSMVLKMDSPESKWKGSRTIPFPRGTGIFCFFSMLVECVAATGFIEEAMEKGNGKMNFHLIWDGYPYVQEQYQYLPDEIFSSAEFVFEGENESGEKKFSLSVGGQTIFYLIKPGGFLTKVFWISQGMSMVEKERL